MSLHPAAIAAALVYPDIATLVTALRKPGSGHVLGVIPFAASCRRLPLNCNALFGRLGGFIHSKKFFTRLLRCH